MGSVEECYRGRSVRVFRLDRDGVLVRLRERARELLRGRADVLEVRVFGSLARGDAGPASDADVLVVLRDGASPFLERIPSLARALSGACIVCDVVAYTESELAASRARAGRFVRTVLAEGFILARRSDQAKV